MSRLIRITNRVLDLDAIAFAQYLHESDTPQSALKVTLQGTQEIRFFNEEADKLWELISSSAMNIPVS